MGKSSLLNHLLPQLKLRIGAVSGRLQRGRHTTRHVELFPIGPHARVADTPGFNRPELPEDPRELACYFQNCDRSWIPGPVVFVIVFTEESPAVVCRSPGSVIPFTSVAWTN